MDGRRTTLTSSQAYFTFLSLAPNASQRTSLQIHQNVQEILKLHEDLLCQLQRAVKEHHNPKSISRREKQPQANPPRRPSHDGHRLAAAVAGFVHTARTSFEGSRPGSSREHSTMANTHKALEFAKIFESLTCRLHVYEEYGAKYELMLRDMATTAKSITNWQAFERCIESLANSLAASSVRDEPKRKGLSLEDLLIKPIQRICKYPLLFEQLYNTTPESDNVEAHTELGKVVRALQESADDINKATNDPETQTRIQQSWRLRDLLIVPDGPTSITSLRLLGHHVLCGVLFVAYESEHEVRGEYMLCALFRSHILLAVQRSGTESYDVVALLSLHDVQVGRTDDGRGQSVPLAAYFEFANIMQVFDATPPPSVG
ncbi:MAG: hypothetical protein Q9174_005962, partial [Haloplaca sp. 1 TL-2023]